MGSLDLSDPSMQQWALWRVSRLAEGAYSRDGSCQVIQLGVGFAFWCHILIVETEQPAMKTSEREKSIIRSGVFQIVLL